MVFLCLTPICEANERVNFNRDIRPLLSTHCFACHGPDASIRKAELRLDVRESALNKNAIVPGKPSASGIISRFEH